MYISQLTMLPPVGGRNPIIISIKVLLPDPVFPIIATLEPGLIVAFIVFNVNSGWSGYLYDKSERTILFKLIKLRAVFLRRGFALVTRLDSDIKSLL